MARTGSLDLFNLIKSLDRTEKRFFKVYASRHVIGRQNNYVRLFNAIDRQLFYNEEELHVSQRYIRQMPLLKNRLYEIILKSLQLYSAGYSEETYLKTQLQSIRILFEKGLYDQCEKMLDRIQRIASENEFHLIQLEIQEWQEKLLYATSFSGSSENDQEQIFTNSVRVVNDYLSLRACRNVGMVMEGRICQDGYPRSLIVLAGYTDLVSKRIFGPGDKTLPRSGRKHFYACMFALFLCRNEVYTAYNWAKKLIIHLEEDPVQITREPESYLHALDGMAICLLRLGMFSEMRELLVKLRKPHHSSKRLEELSMFLQTHHELLLHMRTGNTEKAIEMISRREYLVVSNANKAEEATNKYLANPQYEEEEGSKISLQNRMFRVILQFNFATIHFVAGNYLASVNYLNGIINDYSLDLRSDIQCLSRILNLLAHFELGNFELMEYGVRSTYRFLCRKNGLYRFESLMLGFIRDELIKHSGEKRFLVALSKLREDIKEVLLDPLERRVMESFDFITWIDSKLQNRPFAELIKENRLQRKDNYAGIRKEA